jgi:hypothetical protein
LGQGHDLAPSPRGSQGGLISLVRAHMSALSSESLLWPRIHHQQPQVCTPCGAQQYCHSGETGLGQGEWDPLLGQVLWVCVPQARGYLEPPTLAEAGGTSQELRRSMALCVWCKAGVEVQCFAVWWPGVQHYLWTTCAPLLGKVGTHCISRLLNAVSLHQNASFC